MHSEEKKRVLRDRLQTLAGRDGRLTAAAVVDDAADKKSPLHGEFEWDDSVAGHKYRIEQARTLIASVKVEVSIGSREVAAYVRDPDAKSTEQGYRSVANLKTDRERAREALINEAGRAASYLQRVRDLSVALEMNDQVDEILEEFVVFRGRLAIA